MCVLAILPVWYYGMELILLSSVLLLLSTCSMARGQEETSTSQARRRRGTGRDTPFTWEQLATEICFPISSMVNQFLHFSRAPPTLIHQNVIRILTGCRVLNLLYQLDISLVEVCFIYTLKLGHEGQLSLSAQSSRLQFVTGLPDSPKTEAKGVILVRGPWYETPGSPDLPFALNPINVIPRCVQVVGFVCRCTSILCIHVFS